MVEPRRPSTSASSPRTFRFLKKIVNFFRNQLFSEDALKLHVFMYWLSCLIKLMKSADESFFATLSVALSAFTLISALVAVAGRKPFYLIPFATISVYEIMETLILVNLVNIKFHSPDYYEKLSTNSVCRFLLKNVGTLSEDSLPTYILWSILYATYFGIVVATTLKLMKRYSEFQVRLTSLGSQIILNQALVDELYYGRLVSFPNDLENVVQNADSPPHYSEIFSRSNNTSLPKYSQIKDKSGFKDERRLEE
ncbi:unnamed protein product [Auanema sp. JU1783]|nr:unnamed protein product [Auanema sp. JU1783]